MKLWIKESRSRWSEHHGPLKTIAARFVPAVYAGPFAPAAELFSARFDPTMAGSLGGSSVDGGFADPLLVSITPASLAWFGEACPHSS